MIAKVKVKPNGKKIRMLIAQNGYSLKDFSKIVPLSYPYLSRIVNNRVKITPQMAKRISDKLNIKMLDIFLLNSFTKSETKI
ncbi:helix-turn-helix domain-containing protein [Apilactobacillus micheneri]|uniref:helix-turn-helix domain-containing protein n=1 Tax=Apilactobacillus micheneri TaxID=1899430 RepID=UPI001CDB604F|nr:helix-turn-helix transcriptional regulator [Apilactobacillus micheneri]